MCLSCGEAVCSAAAAAVNGLPEDDGLVRSREAVATPSLIHS